MKSFSDKTNIGTYVTLKTVYMIRFYLLLLLTGGILVIGATQSTPNRAEPSPA